MLEKITANLGDKVEIVTVEGLLADYVEKNNVDFQVRGVRSFADFDSEF
jgi:phosphopantetheine adenylyltransferase